MTDDEITALIRRKRAGKLQAPARAEAVAEVEAVVGHRMPALLRRLYLDVSDGGFDPYNAALSLDDHDFLHSDAGRLVDEYLQWRAHIPGYPSHVVPLLSLGCAMWAHVDWSTPEGRIWRWDPGPCERHSLFRDTVSLSEQLTEWYAGVDRRPRNPPCGPDCLS
ncbi:SMI1/KNR4 family protein [Streptacidiphilus monticola]|uniref:SMI1/KNR4 family protein n=1 Tax=Streptacidiphilus monticola TaxID=2161674 RepID=A0ABW1GC74_9ACTN